MTMRLEDAEAIMDRCDFSSEDKFSAEERQAVVLIMAAYMMGKIDRERAAKAMRCDINSLPTPWQNNA